MKYYCAYHKTLLKKLVVNKLNSESMNYMYIEDADFMRIITIQPSPLICRL